MVLKDDWETGDTFTADAANEVASEVNAKPRTLIFNEGWPDRPDDDVPTIFVGGEDPDDAPDDADLRDGDVWIPENSVDGGSSGGAVVHISGTETVTGDKTFTGTVDVNDNANFRIHNENNFNGYISFDCSNLNVGRNFTVPNAGNQWVTDTAEQLLEGKRVRPRVGETASSATPAINTDIYDQYDITALAANITSMTTNLTGTPYNGEELTVTFKDNGSARTISWGESFTGVLLATTVSGMYHVQILRWSAALSKWVGVYADTAGAS